DNPHYAFGYAVAAYRERRYTEAERGWDAALRSYRDLAARNPGVYQPVVAETLNNLAMLYSDTGQLREAEEAYSEALAMRRGLAARDPGANQPDLASTLNNLGILY